MLAQLFEVCANLLQFSSSCWLLLILIPLLYLYVTRNHDHWKKRGIPGPKPWPVFGNLHEAMFNTGAELERKYFAKYGKIYGTFEGSKPVLLVADPEIVKLIAVKDWQVFINRQPSAFIDPAFSQVLTMLRDDKWKNVRSAISPTFTSGKIRRMMELMKECLKGVLDNLDKAAQTKSELDIKRLFGAYTLDVIARCAFATQTDAHTNPNDPFIKNMIDIFKVSPLRMIVNLCLPQFIRKALDIDIFESRTRTFFKEVCTHLLRQRREGKVKGNDFLQLLIEAEKSESNLESDIRDINEGHFMNEDQDDLKRNVSALSKGASGAKLTDDETVAQMIIFFMAGYETTHTLLGYVSYCLAMNPKVQEALHEELQRAYGTNEHLTYEELNHLEYLNAVVSETLRLFPPAMKLDREAGEDYTLSTLGVTIKKGTGVYIGFYLLHHDEDNFEEPEMFKPERFLKENLHQIKPYTYLPFGVGPRNCIGMRFALAEAKLILAKVVLNYKLVRTENTKLSFNYHPIVLQCKEVMVKVEKR